jgi:hypothetical protein
MTADGNIIVGASTPLRIGASGDYLAAFIWRADPELAVQTLPARPEPPLRGCVGARPVATPHRSGCGATARHPFYGRNRRLEPLSSEGCGPRRL